MRHTRLRTSILGTVRKLTTIVLLSLVAALLFSACAHEPHATPTPDVSLIRVPDSISTPVTIPLPTLTAASTPTPTPLPTPVVAGTPTPARLLTSTATSTPTPTPQLTSTATSTPTPTPPSVELVLDADATVDGYWSDGTADVRIVVSLRNVGDLPLDHAVRLAVKCSHKLEAFAGCGQEASVSLPDGYGMVTETLMMRLPTGQVSLEASYGGETVETLPLDVLKRIVGVNRDVWECFSDSSNDDTLWLQEVNRLRSLAGRDL